MVLRKISFLWLVSLLVLSCGVGSFSWAEESRKFAHLGDISLRISGGAELFLFSNATGEFIFLPIGDSSVSLSLFPEYNYYRWDHLSLFLALPLTLNVEFIGGVFLDLSLGGGFRLDFSRYFFSAWGFLIDFVRRSKLNFNFGGLFVNLGGMFPLNDRFRLFIYASLPFNFISGFYVKLYLMGGVEIFF